jgi:hypothetical protein
VRGPGRRTELLECVVTGILLVVSVGILCITLLTMLGMVLHFSMALVKRNGGDTKCLRDVAVLLRAFRAGPGGLLSTMTKILKRG